MPLTRLWRSCHFTYSSLFLSKITYVSNEVENDCKFPSKTVHCGIFWPWNMVQGFISIYKLKPNWKGIALCKNSWFTHQNSFASFVHVTIFMKKKALAIFHFCSSDNCISLLRSKKQEVKELFSAKYLNIIYLHCCHNVLFFWSALPHSLCPTILLVSVLSGAINSKHIL